jgi:hypothetical protein
MCFIILGSGLLYLPYEENDYTVMVNNFTNINRMGNHLSPQLIEHKIYHDILR